VILHVGINHIHYTTPFYNWQMYLYWFMLDLKSGSQSSCTLYIALCLNKCFISYQSLSVMQIKTLLERVKSWMDTAGCPTSWLTAKCLSVHLGNWQMSVQLVRCGMSVKLEGTCFLQRLDEDSMSEVTCPRLNCQFLVRNSTC